MVRYGDFLISWSATLGAYIWKGSEGILNQHIFKVTSHIDNVFHYHRMLFLIKDLYEYTHGSGMVHITKKKFMAIAVPLPPLAEQKRIASKVEELLSSVDKIRTHLDRIPDILKRLRQSILTAAVSGKLTEDWREENEQNVDIRERNHESLKPLFKIHIHGIGLL